VATNGIETRRLTWIEQGTDGSFYWGLCIPKGDFHSSYHASGKMLFSKHHKPHVWERIAEFKGMRQLSSISMVKDFSKIHYSPFGCKKLDGVVYVDYRTLKSNQISIEIVLIEKGHTESLQTLLKIFPNPMIFIFTCTNPWVVVLVH